MEKAKLIRITTVPMALAYPLKGQCSYMHENGFYALMISSGGKELPVLLENEICPHIVVPMTRSITPVQDLICLFKLCRIFLREKPEIVHSETPKAGLLGMLAAKITRVPLRIHTVAGMPLMVASGMKLNLLKLIEKITYTAATHVWPNSESLRSFILENKFTEASKLMVISKGSSNGVDTARFNEEVLRKSILEEVKKNIAYDPACTYLLFVGRLVKDKGICELVNVFKKLSQLHTGLKLVLVGQFEKTLDPLPAETEKEITHNSSIIHIYWTNKVEYYMSLANFFIFPSYREGFPNVLLEAGAMKLPVICSNIGGNIDIVQHQKTGLVFETYKEPDMAEKIEWGLQNREAMQKMSQVLFENVTTDYKREKFWLAMNSEYKKLLKSTLR